MVRNVIPPLRDAREHDYIPSVTTVLGVGQPALVAWMQTQVLNGEFLHQLSVTVNQSKITLTALFKILNNRVEKSFFG